MRLQREGKMAKRDIETQIKKTGKINDGFICLPDPEDIYTWYYIVFNLDYKQYNGGFYMGKIVCPPEYPAKAPKIQLLHDNGRFHTWNDGICLSISSYHPESWNPVWKVNQIVIGLTSFWQTTEGTYGGVYDNELRNMCKKGETSSDCLIRLAKESREKTMKHEKFHLFEKYAAAIGIDKVPEIKGWDEHQERQEKLEAAALEEKRLAEERKRKQEEERLLKEQQAKLALEQKKIAEAAKMKIEYFQLINQMGLNKAQANKKGMKKAKAA